MKLLFTFLSIIFLLTLNACNPTDGSNETVTETGSNTSTNTTQSSTQTNTDSDTSTQTVTETPTDTATETSITFPMDINPVIENPTLPSTTFSIGNFLTPEKLEVSRIYSYSITGYDSNGDNYRGYIELINHGRSFFRDSSLGYIDKDWYVIDNNEELNLEEIDYLIDIWDYSADRVYFSDEELYFAPNSNVIRRLGAVFQFGTRNENIQHESIRTAELPANGVIGDNGFFLNFLYTDFKYGGVNTQFNWVIEDAGDGYAYISFYGDVYDEEGRFNVNEDGSFSYSFFDNWFVYRLSIKFKIDTFGNIKEIRLGYESEDYSVVYIGVHQPEIM